MTVVMEEKKFDRLWTIVAGVLCLLALILTIVALRTSSWTIDEYSRDGEVEWFGLFQKCNRLKCIPYYNNNFPVIFLSIIGAILLLVSTLFILLMGVHSFPRRHFYITPLIGFITVLLLFIALILYANHSKLNGISARLMMTAIGFGYTSVAIVVFIAGRYSIFYKNNPADFYYDKKENNETVKKVEEQQQMRTGEN